MTVDNSFVDVIHNLDVSIIVPISEDCNVLEYLILQNLKIYKQNGVEILVPFCNKSYENTLLSIIKKYYLINWRLVKVDNHKHKNISLIDIAVQYASKKYILLSANNTVFTINVPHTLRQLLNHYSNCYAVVNSSSIIFEGFYCPLCILVEKQYLDRIHINYSKELIDLLCLSFILDKIMLNKIVTTDACFVTDTDMHLSAKLFDFPEFLYSKEVFFVSRKKYSNKLGILIYDWENNIYSEDLCLDYLKSFGSYWIKDDAFNCRYEKVILCQSYNEIELITDFLDNMGKYFDGIILLDDGSTDGTYEKAIHKKLLIKFRKNHIEFNDLENRNTLLDIASFLKSKWFCFMDIDERFDPRYINFFKTLKTIKANNVGFMFIHLWDNLERYNYEMQDCIYEGLFYRWRLFRNIGRTNIIPKQIKLHFPTTPIKIPYLLAPVLVHHLGNLTLERRKNKYNMYKKEDIYKDGIDNEDLLSKENTKDVNKISKKTINKAIMYSKAIAYNSICLSDFNKIR